MRFVCRCRLSTMLQDTTTSQFFKHWLKLFLNYCPNVFMLIFFYTCEVRLFLSLPPGWLRCQHQCERQRQSDPPALCCQVNIDPPDDQLLSSLSTLVCNLYRFKISAGASESKNIKTGLVSTYISDQSIKRVLDISETLWLNHNKMSRRRYLRKLTSCGLW